MRDPRNRPEKRFHSLPGPEIADFEHERPVAYALPNATGNELAKFWIEVDRSFGGTDVWTGQVRFDNIRTCFGSPRCAKREVFGNDFRRCLLIWAGHDGNNQNLTGQKLCPGVTNILAPNIRGHRGHSEANGRSDIFRMRRIEVR